MQFFQKFISLKSSKQGKNSIGIVLHPTLISLAATSLTISWGGGRGNWSNEIVSLLWTKFFCDKISLREVVSLKTYDFDCTAALKATCPCHLEKLFLVVLRLTSGKLTFQSNFNSNFLKISSSKIICYTVNTGKQNTSSCVTLNHLQWSWSFSSQLLNG